MRSGGVYLKVGALQSVGSSVYNWSELARLESDYAYLLGVDETQLYISNYGDRAIALLVRKRLILTLVLLNKNNNRKIGSCEI